jgi:hypothetical protein
LIVVCAHHRRCVAAAVFIAAAAAAPIVVCTIVDYKPTATEELSPSTGHDLEAKSRIRRQAGDNEKRLILVGVQTEATGQVTAMVVARIK